MSKRVSRLGRFFCAVTFVVAGAVGVTGCASSVDAPTTSDAAVAQDPTALRATLAARRQHHIDELQSYAQAGAFPRNRVAPGKLNIFRDDDGHLCAVANMVHLDGLDALVDTTAKTNNFVRVADEPSGALHDWVLGSGFTREEIALIQEPYIREQPANPDFAKNEDARLRAHFAETIAQLQSSTDASLDIAVKRAIDADVAPSAA
jgi:hypothetical protein